MIQSTGRDDSRKSNDSTVLAPGPDLLKKAPSISCAHSKALLEKALSKPVGPVQQLILSRVDASKLNDADRLTYLSAWQQALNWVQARHQRAVAAAAGAPCVIDQELPAEAQRHSVSGSLAEDSRMAEIGATLRITPLAAKRLVDSARAAATTVEPVLEQMLAGRWTINHLRRAIDAVENHQADLARAATSAAVRRGLRASPSNLKRRIQQELVSRDSVAVSERIKANRRRRSVNVWAHDDFVGELNFVGSWDRMNTTFRHLSRRAEQVLDTLRAHRRNDPHATFCCPAAVARALVQAGMPDVDSRHESVTHTTQEPPVASALFVVPPCPDCGSTSRDLPTLDQLRADALFEAGALLAHHMERTTGVGTEELIARRGNRWRHAVVVTDMATAMGLAEEPGWVPGYGYVPADISRELLSSASSWQRFLLDDHGRVSGVGQHTYRPSSRLRDLISARDLICTFPGCERWASSADLDHRENFDGTNTTESNLHALCRTHHRLKTYTEWGVGRDPQGVDHWRSPSGREYVDQPPDPPWPRPGNDTWTGDGPTSEFSVGGSAQSSGGVGGSAQSGVGASAQSGAETPTTINPVGRGAGVSGSLGGVSPFRVSRIVVSVTIQSEDDSNDVETVAKTCESAPVEHASATTTRSIQSSKSTSVAEPRVETGGGSMSSGRSPPESGHPRPTPKESPHYLGIDACKGGWVGVIINDQGYTSAVKCSSIAQLIAYASDLGNVCVIGIDVPIGLPTKQIRPADTAVRAVLGSRKASLFTTPTAEALALRNPEASNANRAAIGIRP